jgi:hypothetical protein
MIRARRTDPETSHEAAESVENSWTTRQHIWRLLTNPMTDVELVEVYSELVRAGIAPRASESGIRSRRSELVAVDKVQDSGDRVKLPSGRRAIVWQAI